MHCLVIHTQEGCEGMRCSCMNPRVGRRARHSGAESTATVQIIKITDNSGTADFIINDNPSSSRGGSRRGLPGGKVHVS